MIGKTFGRKGDSVLPRRFCHAEAIISEQIATFFFLMSAIIVGLSSKNYDKCQLPIRGLSALCDGRNNLTSAAPT